MNPKSNDNNQNIDPTILTQINLIRQINLVRVKKELCDNCKGVGLVKYEPIYVNDIKYIPCAPCGTIRKPYDICDTCHGSGNKDDDN